MSTDKVQSAHAAPQAYGFGRCCVAGTALRIEYSPSTSSIRREEHD